MKIEEEKRLVAEKLMGWRVDELFPDDPHWRPEIQKQDGTPLYYFHNWNPHKDRNRWPEIWDKMTERQRITYIQNLLCVQMDVNEPLSLSEIFDIHTTSPEIYWKALIEVLTEKE